MFYVFIICSKYSRHSNNNIFLVLLSMDNLFFWAMQLIIIHNKDKSARDYQFGVILMKLYNLCGTFSLGLSLGNYIICVGHLVWGYP